MATVIVDITRYRNGVRVTPDPVLADLHPPPAHRADGSEMLWLDLHDPTAAEMARIVDALGLPRIAIDDAVSGDRQPGLVRYDQDTLLLVLRTLHYQDDTDAVQTGMFRVFIGRSFLVTVGHGPPFDLTDVRQSLGRRGSGLGHGTTAALVGICRQMLAGAEQVVAALGLDVDAVEDSVLAATRSDSSTRIHLLRRELAEVRRAIVPLRDPLERLVDGDAADLDVSAASSFRHLADRLARVSESVESLDGLLTSVFAAQLAQIAVQQNEDMRKITAAVGIAVVPTVITGLYGMNFERMPELHWAFGYPFAVLLMILGCGLLYWLFRRSGWL